MIAACSADLIPVTPKRVNWSSAALHSIASLLVLILLSSSALAWGRIGHRATALLAQELLTPEARSEATRLLRLEGSTTLAQIAVWADRIKVERRPSAPRHTVRIPNAEEFYDAKRDCVNLCVVRGLDQYIAVLSDRARSDTVRLEALKYIVHLVGDIHQPLHASETGGQELVRWATETVKLHKLWDTTLIVGAYKSPNNFIHSAKLQGSTLQACGTPQDWANESHGIVRQFVYPALGSTPAIPMAISQEYARRALVIIEKRINLGASRLACVLNNALQYSAASK